MGYILGEPTVQQYFDANGDPLENGTIEFFIWNTSTPTAIYSDSTGTSAGTSVTLNSIGAPANGGTSIALFFDTNVIYKIVRKDAAGSAIAPTIGPYQAGGWADEIEAIDAGASDSLYDYIGRFDNQQTSVAGYYTPGDEGGGQFFWDAASFATDDGGSVILPTGHTGSGRWVRILVDSINVKMFGAKGDGVANDLTFIQSAINYIESNVAGTINVPRGIYRITAPLINNFGQLNLIGDSPSGGGLDVGTQIYLDSSTAGDYCLKYSGSTYSSINSQIRNIGFKGTNNANNQGAILYAGRMSRSSIERCEFQDFTGYAIARDPAATNSYSQNNVVRDCGFYYVGGVYGLLQDPVAGSAYLGESLLTWDNINLDNGINPTDPKPYIVDFRASREIVCGILLMEGVGVTGTQGCMAFGGNTANRFDQIHIEFTGIAPPVFAYMDADEDNRYYSQANSELRIGYLGAESPFHFGTNSTNGINESRVYVENYSHYGAASLADVCVWDGPTGFLEIKNVIVKTAFNIPEQYRGRANIGQSGEDFQQHNIGRFQSKILASWDAGQGELGKFKSEYIQGSTSATTFEGLVVDGNVLVQQLTGTAGVISPKMRFDLTWPASLNGSYFCLALEYESIIDAADATTLFGAFFNDNTGIKDPQRINAFVKNGGYQIGYFFGRFDTAGTAWIEGAAYSVLPTVAPIYRIRSMRLWSGVPNEISLPQPLSINTLRTHGENSPTTFTSADATPSVAGYELFKTAGTTAITDFDNGVLGQTIKILATGSITIVDGASIILGGGGNFNMTASDTLTLTMFDDGVWQEVGRSVN